MQTKISIIAAIIGAIAAKFVLLAFLSGCASPSDKDQRCATYADAYALYIGTTAVRTPSKEEVAAAAGAAIFLRAYCGWTGNTTAATKGANPKPEVDANGVPIIYPPSR